MNKYIFPTTLIILDILAGIVYGINGDYKKLIYWIIEKRINKCIETLNVKQAEYSSEIDRLHNFKVAAAVQGITPISALGGMMCKHTVSVYDLIRDIENGFLTEQKIWEEKIGDSINYLLLLTALLEDYYENERAVDYK